MKTLEPKLEPESFVFPLSPLSLSLSISLPSFCRSKVFSRPLPGHRPSYLVGGMRHLSLSLCLSPMQRYPHAEPKQPSGQRPIDLLDLDVFRRQSHLGGAVYRVFQARQTSMCAFHLTSSIRNPRETRAFNLYLYVYTYVINIIQQPDTMYKYVYIYMHTVVGRTNSNNKQHK